MTGNIKREKFYGPSIASLYDRFQKRLTDHYREQIDNVVQAHHLYRNPAVLLKPDGTVKVMPPEELYKTRSDSGAPINKMEKTP